MTERRRHQDPMSAAATAVCGFCRARLTAATPDLLRDDADGSGEDQ